MGKSQSSIVAGPDSELATQAGGEEGYRPATALSAGVHHGLVIEDQDDAVDDVHGVERCSRDELIAILWLASLWR
jgi:hypothetical protein